MIKNVTESSMVQDLSTEVNINCNQKRTLRNTEKYNTLKNKNGQLLNNMEHLQKISLSYDNAESKP